MTISALGGNQPPLPIPSQSGSAPNVGGGGDTSASPPVVQQQSAPAQASTTPVATQAEVQKALDAVRKAVSDVAPDALQFSVDSSSGRMVVQVMDTQTNQVLQQIPSENMLAIAQSLDKMQGLLFKQKV